jgi:hypothetical protein
MRSFVFSIHSFAYRYAAKQQQGSHELQRHGSSKDGSTNRDAAKAGKPTTTGSQQQQGRNKSRDNSKSKDASSRVANFGQKNNSPELTE